MYLADRNNNLWQMHMNPCILGGPLLNWCDTRERHGTFNKTNLLKSQTE